MSEPRRSEKEEADTARQWHSFVSLSLCSALSALSSPKDEHQQVVAKLLHLLLQPSKHWVTDEIYLMSLHRRASQEISHSSPSAISTSWQWALWWGQYEAQDVQPKKIRRIHAEVSACDGFLSIGHTIHVALRFGETLFFIAAATTSWTQGRKLRWRLLWVDKLAKTSCRYGLLYRSKGSCHENRFHRHRHRTNTSVCVVLRNKSSRDANSDSIYGLNSEIGEEKKDSFMLTCYI